MDDELSPRKVIKRKPITPKTNNKITQQQRKTSPSFLSFPTNDQKKLMIDVRDVQKNIGLKINQQNISLIAKKQEMSFISNRQDHSMDSFDKMIMGVDEELDIQQQNTSNSKQHQPNYSMLYQQFQRLIKGQKVFKSQVSFPEIQQQSESILHEEISQEQDKSKEISFDLNRKSLIMQKTSKDKADDSKLIRRSRVASTQGSSIDPNISLRLAGASLSEIHQEEIQHNSSISRMDPIQQEFIDFVSKNNEASKINISKIEKNSEGVKEKKVKFKNELNTSLKAQVQQDEVVAMLENELGSRRENLIGEQFLLEEQASISKIKNEKEYYEKENYNQILRELDENEDNKKLDNSNGVQNISVILSKRQEWINSRKDRSAKWRQHELQFLGRVKQILYNPYIQFSDEQQFPLQE